jgi:signal peptidase I
MTFVQKIKKISKGFLFCLFLPIAWPIRELRTKEPKGKKISAVILSTVILLPIWVFLSFFVYFGVIITKEYIGISKHPSDRFYMVSGSSMLPTFSDGQNTLIYSLKKQLDRGCVVLVDSKDLLKDSMIIKRIIALPGDEIMFDGRNVYLNGKLLEEKYVSGMTQTFVNGYVKNGQKYKIDIDKYFIMGDNREHSADSREFGPVEKERILGYANDPNNKELNRCNESDIE